MKTILPSAGSVLMACGAAWSGLADTPDVTVLTSGYRQFVGGDKAYRVETPKTPAEPAWVADSLLFAFDCSQTNGWTVADDGTVTKVPSRVGDRYMTVGDPDDLVEDLHCYGPYGLYYSQGKPETAIKPGTLVRDADLDAACLDFGASGSRNGLFFNAIPVPWTQGSYSGERQNVLTNIGSVVGVYKSAEGAGNLLAGNQFQRFVGYGKDAEGRSKDGVGLRFPLVKNNVPGDLKYGSVWTGQTQNAPDKAKWNGLWQVIAANPSAATLTSYGIGMGNIDNTDEAVSSGGQKIAELLIFDRVLTEAETRELIAYLERKWLDHDTEGQNGSASVAWLALGSSGFSPPDTPQTVTLDVPTDETLTLERLDGGRGNGVGPTVEKTGAGALAVGTAESFGGRLAVRGGTLKVMGVKAVPTFDQLAPYLTLHLDPSDADSLTLEDGDAVSAWANTAAYAVTGEETNCVVQTDAVRRPVRVMDALGTGLDVLDFGRYGASGKYMAFSPTRVYQTVVAVVDARMYGGGNVMSKMFAHYQPKNIDNGSDWHAAALSRLLDTTSIYVSDFSFGQNGMQVPNDAGDVWVNGHRVDKDRAGNEAPAWQVVAWRMPGGPGDNGDLKWLLGAASASRAGGLRLGEVLGWGGALPDEAIRDAVAYLMKKWLGRVPAGYDDGLGVPTLQNLAVGGADGAVATVDVAEGATLTVGSLATDGPAAKTGAGTLAIVSGADISGGLEVRGGRLAVVDGPDVSSACEVAANPSLRLDASDAASLLFVRVGDYGATNFIWNWTDRSGRIAALQSREGNYTTKKPFLNDAAEALCNGLPVVDFGAFHGDWDNGGATAERKDVEARTLGLSRTLTNIRSVYLVYGSQAGGGQPLGCSNRNPISSNIEGRDFANFASLNDFLRSGTPDTITVETPLFGSASPNVKNGELWINGERQERVDSWAPSGGYDLVELHTAGGCMANMLGNAFGDYAQGGFRIGEIIVFERPLSAREKTATRNYLLKKWFGKADAELAALPEKTARATLVGDLTYGDGAQMVFDVSEGAIVNPLALSGTLTFEAGARVIVRGFDRDVRLCDRLVLGTVNAAEGLANAVLDFDGRTFAPDVQPHLRLIGRRLCVCFGKIGTWILIR